MAATEAKDTRRRVKLYVLNEKRVWDDRGTGHVSCTVNEKLGGTTLVVQSETDGTGLLESKIQMDTAYQKQQETLIVWSEGENYDLALSFQEKGGCDDIWEKICQVQGKDPSVEVTQEVGYEGESDSESGEPAETGTTASSTAGLPLPPCEISRLAEINELFNSCLCTPFRREHLAVAIETDGYIKKLVEIFHICEDLENRESLSILYQIFKSIFMLNKNSIYEILFSEDLIEDVVGVLEYDPISPVKKNHREYLWKTAKFKEVIPITSGDLRAKIHQTFRVQYIQDMILPTPSIFEENMLSTLTSFIFFNKVEIVSLIQDDDTFLTTLFTQLSDAKTERDRRRELMQFLREFCSFSQTQQPQNREQFYRTLSSHGILSVIEVCIQADDEQTRLSTIEIFSNVVDYNPSLVRDYMIQQGPARSDDKSLFLNIIIDQMFADKDPGTFDRPIFELGGAVQLLGVLRVLLDPENMMTALTNKAEKTEFLAFFYKRCMYNLCQPLFANTVEVDSHPAKDDYRTAHMLSLILEILSFCIEHHAYHVRNYVLNKDILRRVLVLLKSKHSFLQLGALRFLRRIIQLKDEFFNRYIVRQKLFGPVVECFFANGHKYNLLNSALLELFEFIRLEDIKTLCLYIVETYMDQFKEVDYVQTFRALKLRYEQQLDRINNKTPVFSDGFRSPAATCLQPTTQRVRRDQREMDEDEEAWFNEEDDEEWDDSQSPVTVTTHRPPGSSSSPSPNQSLNGSPSRSSPPLSPSRGNSGVGSPSSSSPQQQRIQISTASIVLSQSTQNKENVDASRLSPGFTRSVISCGSPNSRSSPVLMVSSAPLSPGCVSPRSTSPSVSPSDSVALLLNKGSLVDYDLDDESDEETQESSASAENKSPPCQLPVVTDLPDSGETSGSCAVVDSTSSTSDKATFDDQEDVVPSLPDDRMSAVSSSDCPMIPDIFTTSPRQEISGAAPLNNGDPRDDRLMFNDLLSDLSDHKSLNGAADSGCHSVGNGPSAYAMDNSSEVSPPTSPLGGNNEAEPSAACMSERMEAESDFCLPTNTELSLNAASEPDKSAIPSTVASVDADSSVADTPQVKRQRLSPPEGLPVPLSH